MVDPITTVGTIKTALSSSGAFNASQFTEFFSTQLQNNFGETKNGSPPLTPAQATAIATTAYTIAENAGGTERLEDYRSEFQKLYSTNSASLFSDSSTSMSQIAMGLMVEAHRQKGTQSPFTDASSQESEQRRIAKKRSFEDRLLLGYAISERQAFENAITTFLAQNEDLIKQRIQEAMLAGTPQEKVENFLSTESDLIALFIEKNPDLNLDINNPKHITMVQDMIRTQLVEIAVAEFVKTETASGKAPTSEEIAIFSESLLNENADQLTKLYRDLIDNPELIDLLAQLETKDAVLDRIETTLSEIDAKITEAILDGTEAEITEAEWDTLYSLQEALEYHHQETDEIIKSAQLAATNSGDESAVAGFLKERGMETLTRTQDLANRISLTGDDTLAEKDQGDPQEEIRDFTLEAPTIEEMTKEAALQNEARNLADQIKIGGGVFPRADFDSLFGDLPDNEQQIVIDTLSAEGVAGDFGQDPELAQTLELEPTLIAQQEQPAPRPEDNQIPGMSPIGIGLG